MKSIKIKSRTNSLESSLQNISSNWFIETNQLFGSDSNVILTQQTCGHPSSRVAGSKRQSLAFYFPVRIWYILLISKCRGKSEFGLCMTLVLAKRLRLRSADFQQILMVFDFFWFLVCYADTQQAIQLQRSVGQSTGLLIPSRFDSGKDTKNLRTQIYMDLSYSARVLNYCCE